MTKRIALFSPSLAGGGAERVMMNLARGFVDRGNSVDLVLSSAKGEYLEQIDSRVRLVDLRARRVATSLPALIKYLRTQKPSALLSTQGHANVIALIAGSFPGIATRIIVRDTYSIAGASDRIDESFSASIKNWLTRHFYAKAHGVVAVCEDLKSEIAQTTKVPSEKITVIYNPIAIDDISQRMGEPSGHDWLDCPSRKVILSIGRLERQKDFFTLIRAFSIVRQNIDARLLILGEGGLRTQLTDLVRSLKLDDYVDFPGFVANPYSYISRADTFVLSSLCEGLPNVLLEALAIGTPIVATDCKTGPREILRGGEDGILVPLQDPLALAKGIITSLTNKTRAQPAPESLQRFEFQHVIDQYLNLLHPQY